MDSVTAQAVVGQGLVFAIALFTLFSIDLAVTEMVRDVRAARVRVRADRS